MKSITHVAMVSYSLIKSPSVILFVCSLILLGTGPAYSQGGIAEKYIRDAGIEKDPDVIFSEKFEDSVAAVASRFVLTQNTAGMSLLTDVPSTSGGTKSLQMTAVGGSNTGGYLYKNLAAINASGYDELYVRWYVKYGSTGTLHHNGMWVGGQNPSSNFIGFSPCCNAPTGSNFFYIGIEPGHPSGLGLDMYTDWMEMKISPDNVNYYGNNFMWNRVTLNANQWYCIEVRLKMNTPTTGRSGELQLWVDGAEIIHLSEGSPLGSWTNNLWTTGSGSTPFEGFRWRSTTSLPLNWLWLNHYSDANPNGVTTSIQWDDVVVATKYIGPLNTSAPGIPAAPSNLTVQ